MAAESLADVLLVRAGSTPDAVAYESVDSSGAITALNYAQVAARASALADQISGCGDGPVLLAVPAGLDYPVAVFGAFLAGRPVIPAFPPGPGGPDRGRLDGIVADARPSVVVAAQRYPELAAVPAVVGVPGAEADHGPPARSPGSGPDDVAVIQYTSGSTGHPRGVLVRHGGITANTAAIADRFELTGNARGLTWLPPFHDMGLVGGLLTPVAAGIPIRIMPPGDFLKSPLWWLRQITESGATASGGPDFAYALCVRRVRARGEEALAGLDLSGWRVAFSGGEAVRRRTLTEFAETFAPAGFRPEFFLPCYGLAEATLMVSAGHWRPAPGAVSCGTPVPGQRVVVVDPERPAPVADGEEGEIWVTGPHITPGYLSGLGEEDLFGELGGTRWLRTGDLGYRDGGELFVTGRRKDVIVLRGVNHHAVDVEAAALDAAGRSAGTAASFLVDLEPEPFAGLVLEVRGRPDPGLVPRVRAAVLQRTGLRLGVVALVPVRSVPRTSSGKVRRAMCRDALLAGTYEGAVDGEAGPLRALALRRERDAVVDDLSGVICGIVAELCDADDCRPDDRLVDLGVDSVRAAEAADILGDTLDLDVPLEVVLSAATPRAAASALLDRWLGQGSTPGRVRERLTAIDVRSGVS